VAATRPLTQHGPRTPGTHQRLACFRFAVTSEPGRCRCVAQQLHLGKGDLHLWFWFLRPLSLHLCRGHVVLHFNP